MKKTPQREAIRLTQLLQHVPEEERFPVDVQRLAKEVSQNNADPIDKIVGGDLPGFEGMLRPHQKRPGWHIVYNDDPKYSGRSRFTIAHEFGHYQLHRPKLSLADYRNGPPEKVATFQCKPLHADTWEQMDREREEEADTFASFLLMPIDDYRAQVRGHDMSPQLLEHVTDRYGVSLLAAIRKWVDFTERRTAMVVSRSGFALWGRASKPAFKTGIFIRKGMPIPDLVNLEIEASPPGFLSDLPIERPQGVWAFSRGSESVRELTIHSNSLDLAISVLEF